MGEDQSKYMSSPQKLVFIRIELNRIERKKSDYVEDILMSVSKRTLTLQPIYA